MTSYQRKKCFFYYKVQFSYTLILKQALEVSTISLAVAYRLDKNRQREIDRCIDMYVCKWS